MYTATTSPDPPPAELAEVFAGMADPTRLELLLRLTAVGSQSVGELVVATGVRQPSVSKHLACLHGCGLLERERRGRVVVYSIASEDVGSLLQAGKRVWDLASCGDACSCPICLEGR